MEEKFIPISEIKDFIDYMLRIKSEYISVQENAKTKEEYARYEGAIRMIDKIVNPWRNRIMHIENPKLFSEYMKRRSMSLEGERSEVPIRGIWVK